MRKEIESQINPDQPTAEGDEAKLYRVKVNGEAYWAKKWHRSQIDERWMMQRLQKGSATSPYFHQLRKAEYDLIHRAFPGITVEMVDAYDERVQGTEKQPKFDMSGGKPTTVTREVKGDPELMAKRNEIVEKGAERSRQYMRSAEMGLIDVGQAQRYIMQTRADAEDAMQKLVGPELQLPIYEFAGLSWEQAEPQIIQKLRRQNPENTIIELLEWGIMPAFPEGNFIPGDKETHPRPPHGTFIELKLKYPDKFRRKLEKELSEKEQQTFKADLDKYELYKKLDEMFYDILFSVRYPGTKSQWPMKPDFQSAVFRTLEAVKNACERGAFTAEDRTLDSITDTIIDMVYTQHEMLQFIAKINFQIRKVVEKL
jgi:hypothetical protein